MTDEGKSKSEGKRPPPADVKKAPVAATPSTSKEAAKTVTPDRSPKPSSSQTTEPQAGDTNRRPTGATRETAKVAASTRQVPPAANAAASAAQPAPPLAQPSAPLAQPSASVKPAAEPAPRPLPPLATQADIAAIVDADHRDPFSFLGMHALRPDVWVVRAFLPQAKTVAVIDAASGKLVATLDRVHEAGLFAGAIVDRRERFRYRFRVAGEAGVAEVEDSYRFPPILTEGDTRLLAEGSHLRAYDKLGAHLCTVDGVVGASFAVWAPNAHRVAVIGEFNDWDGRRHGMRLRHECGVWEIFVPGVKAGQFYKFEIKSQPGQRPSDRGDPCAFRAERWPGTASIVHDLRRYVWGDQAWMAARSARHHREAPLAIYEVHLGSWRRNPAEDARWLTYRELAEQLPGYAKDMGFTHVELMPISEFNFEGSWGYHPIALFAPTGRFGDPDDLRYLIDRCHQAGIGVILNWVMGQFPDDPQGIAEYDGSILYEHPDPRQRRHPRWNTLMYDYGRPAVANYLLSNALYWLDHYHIDGLRVDSLAPILYLDYDRRGDEWTPNRFGGHENLEAVDFVRRLNETIAKEFPAAFTVAEESSGWPMVSRPTFVGGLGFHFKWNEKWIDDILRYMSRNPIHRKYYHQELTHGPLHFFQENYVTALSHNYVSYGHGPLLARMPGNRWDKFANARAFFSFVYTQPGKKLMFMGNEFVQEREWNHEISLDWHLMDDPLNRGMQSLIRSLNRLYSATPALHEFDSEPQGFSWIDCNDTEQSIISFLRFSRSGTGTVAIVCNFTPVVRQNYRIGVPLSGYWAERLNSDAADFGGSNTGNEGGIWASDEGLHGRPHSLGLVLPPYAAVVLEHVGDKPA